MLNDYTYRGQHLRKWVPLVGIGFAVLLAVLLVVLIARHKPVPAQYYAERPYTQPNGTVVMQQPDHGWFYYWMLTQMNRPVQPTYHVYVPPPPRPAYVPRPSDSYTSAPSSSSPYRSGGGFGSSSPSRSYSSPSSSSPYRSSGGFGSSSSSSGSSYRSSGGFGSSSRPSSGSSSRSSGGFSSSRPRSGGFRR